MAISYRVEGQIGIIELDQPDSKVNLLTASVVQRLDTILDEVAQSKNLKAILIMSKKKDIFIAGADIKEIEGITESKDGEEKSKAGQRVLDKLEDLKVPSVGVIDGVALGGGCELALACCYRVATFNEKVMIGLPEVKLGIMPGFGGCYRLPKLIGLIQGLKLILAGKTLSAQEALKTGLVDRLFPQKGLESSLRQFIDEIQQAPGKNLRRRKKKMGQFLLEDTFLGRAIVLRQSYQSIQETTKGFYPAPLTALATISKMQGLSRSQALALEAKAFGQLAVTQVSKNLVKLFYLTEKYKKLTPPGTENILPKTIEKCAVVGAGIMGGGIAQLLSSKGIWVRLKDINYDAIAKGLKAAYQIYKKEAEKRKLKKHEAAVKMARISGTLDFSGFHTTGMVIEAVVENMEVKKKVFKELSSVVSPETILCTNTSALSVTEMARQTKDPSRVIGLHFFNPVNRMPLIEIIKTDFTSPATIATTLALTKRLGKTPILVKDSCGFLVNRILLSYINEAGRILEEGERIEFVDKIAADFGLPMGPFALSDEVGLDVGIKVLHILAEAFGERFKPVDAFEKIYAKGLLGKKSGKGLYIYGKKRVPNPEIYELFSRKTAYGLSPDEYLKRMIYIMINEAGRCLEESIIDGPEDVDIGMIMGTGFPAFRGGLLRYADAVGIAKIVDELQLFQNKLQSDRFAPCRYLLNLKEKNLKIYTT